jgi:hypothetical protein
MDSPRRTGEEKSRIPAKFCDISILDDEDAR